VSAAAEGIARSSSATRRRVNRCEELKKGAEYCLPLRILTRETTFWTFSTQTTPVIFGVRFRPDIDDAVAAASETWIVRKREHAAHVRKQTASCVAPCDGIITLQWGGAVVAASMGGGGGLSSALPVRVTIKQRAVAALIVDVGVVAAPCSAAQWRERWDGGLAAPATECAVFRAPCSLHVTTLVAVSALRQEFAECQRLVSLNGGSAGSASGGVAGGASGAADILKRGAHVDELATWLVLRLDSSLKQLSGPALRERGIVKQRVDDLFAALQRVLWSADCEGQRAALWLHAVSAVTKAARVGDAADSATEGGGESYYRSLVRRAERADGDAADEAWAKTRGEIDRDIHRTLPREPRLPAKSARREVLRRVLRAYAVHRPSITDAATGCATGGGYTQGVNVLLAMGLRSGMAEEASFWFLAAMVEDVLPGYNHPQLRGLLVDLEIFLLVFNQCLPEIAAKLDALSVQLEWCVHSARCALRAVRCARACARAQRSVPPAPPPPHPPPHAHTPASLLASPPLARCARCVLSAASATQVPLLDVHVRLR
jgi:hypothetical protein